MKRGRQSHWQCSGVGAIGSCCVCREFACCIRVADTFSQFILVAQSCLTLCDPMDCKTPGFPVHHQLLEPTRSCPSCQWCHPTISSSAFPFSSCFQSFPVSVFSGESALRIRWPNYWSFSISSSSEYSVLIFFRIDWFDLLALQETLKNLLQPHRSKAPILLHSAFCMPNSHIHTWLLEKP